MTIDPSLVLRARAGDATARNDVILASMPMLARLSRSVWCGSTRATVGDLRQVGVLAIVRAVERWEDGRASFETWAAIWVLGAMRRELAGGDSIDDSADVEALAGCDAGPECSTRGCELGERLTCAMAALTLRERIVVERRKRGWSFEAIGTEIGTSDEWARRIERAAHAKLRTAIGG